MAKHKVTLIKGITVGVDQHLEAVLKELTAGDVIEAAQESERLIMVPGNNGQEPRLVHSNALMGINTLRRQIASIGEIQGPIEMDQLALLSDQDLGILQAAAEAMDTAVATAVINRGRSKAASGDD